MNIKDLKGKRVNIGNPGSGQRQNSIDALEANGLDWEKDIRPNRSRLPKRPDCCRTAESMRFFTR
jgi:TRAP-type uncharacterized transport system substrate-binding protein